MADEDPTPSRHLPHGIMEEFLWRLPVKSVVRFKCVSKSWNSLFSEMHFVRKHAETVNQNNNEVIMISQHHIKTCSVLSLYQNPSPKTLDLDHQLIGRDYYRVLGSSNGLICVCTDNRTLFLWNPTTKVKQKLPDPDIQFGSSGGYVTYGFGYDQLNNDYKVVALITQKTLNTTEAKVYSIGQNKWRTLNGFPRGMVVRKSKPGVYANGSLSWCAINSGGGGVESFVIVSHDLSKETFKLEDPPDSCRDGCFGMTLGEVGGSLAMVCYCRRKWADVLVTKEMSWKKIASIWDLVDYAKPLWVSSEGEILLEMRIGLAMYDTKDGKFRILPIHGISNCRDAKLYAHTLVSPNAPR